MIELVTGDITTLAVDAIVNAANSALRGGGGVDGAIHRAAGPELLGYLRRFQGCPTGSAVITPGFKLPARFILHAVGPVYRDGRGGEPELLTSAYDVSFQLALEEPSIRTIAFPAISTGVYGYPKEEAARIALSRMRANEAAFDRIVPCLFDAESAAIYRKQLDAG
jgi:O-acetyl-ADP-ribose deacetylase (regulator of RNase III)